MPRIEVEGLREIRARFQKFPQKYKNTIMVNLRAALHILWEQVPPYPKQWPNSTYVRQGILAKSLGSDMDTGGKSAGRPDIFEVKMGPQMSGATFGSRLEYAPRVIGEGTQEEMFRQRGWWTMATIAKRAVPRLNKLFERMVTSLARWLDGKGL